MFLYGEWRKLFYMITSFNCISVLWWSQRRTKTYLLFNWNLFDFSSVSCKKTKQNNLCYYWKWCASFGFECFKRVNTKGLKCLWPSLFSVWGTLFTSDERMGDVFFAPLWYFALCRLCAEHEEGEWVETDSCHYLSVHICMFVNPAETKIKLLQLLSTLRGGSGVSVNILKSYFVPSRLQKMLRFHWDVFIWIVVPDIEQWVALGDVYIFTHLSGWQASLLMCKSSSLFAWFCMNNGFLCRTWTFCWVLSTICNKMCSVFWTW